MIGVATPVTDEQKAKLRAKLGRDFFLFNHPPTRASVRVGDMDVPALRWDFTDLDPLLRIVMVSETMKTLGYTLDQADNCLRATSAYFIEADLVLGEATVEQRQAGL